MRGFDISNLKILYYVTYMVHQAFSHQKKETCPRASEGSK
jgi:hypothetical protein